MSKTVTMTRSDFVSELADAHMRGYSQGTITGLELAERMTGVDLSEAKKVVLEEAEKDREEHGNSEEAHIDRRDSSAVKRSGRSKGSSTGGDNRS